MKLERYKCVPEGSGLAMWTGMNDRSAFTRKNVAFLMFGHRNTSSLFFRKGTLCRQLCSTTELGFYDLTDKMGHKVAGLSRNDVLRAIKTQHNGYWKQGSWPKKIASEINWSVITTRPLAKVFHGMIKNYPFLELVTVVKRLPFDRAIASR